MKKTYDVFFTVRVTVKAKSTLNAKEKAYKKLLRKRVDVQEISVALDRPTKARSS